MILQNIGKALTAAAAASLAIVAVFTAQIAKADAATQPSTQPTGSITVLVIDSDKNPVSGATIRVAPAGHAAGLSVKGTADDKGSFTFTDIPAGRYNVRASMKGVGQGRARVDLNPGAEGSANVTVTITLAPRDRAPASQPS